MCTNFHSTTLQALLTKLMDARSRLQSACVQVEREREGGREREITVVRAREIAERVRAGVGDKQSEFWCETLEGMATNFHSTMLQALRGHRLLNNSPIPEQVQLLPLYTLAALKE
jgi:RNA-splicing ligase RtcB